jgi:single-strand DNA-binding protein
MSNFNQCTFIGRMGKDPELRYLPDGTAAASISIGVSERWKDKNTSEQREHTEWVRCSAMGKLAEIIGEYGTKGMLVFVQGKMKTNKWQDRDGNDRYTTEIRLEKWLMLGSKGSNQESRQEPSGHGNLPPEARTPPGGFDAFDDDIPF